MFNVVGVYFVWVFVGHFFHNRHLSLLFPKASAGQLLLLLLPKYLYSAGALRLCGVRVFVCLLVEHLISGFRYLLPVVVVFVVFVALSTVVIFRGICHLNFK